MPAKLVLLPLVAALDIAGLFPFATSDGASEFEDGVLREVAAAAILAEWHFNERNGSVVNDLSRIDCSVVLNVTVHNTYASAYEGLRLAQTLQAQAVVGPALSEVAGPVALASSVRSVPVVSYWATSDLLDEQYPYLCRTVPADGAAAAAAVAWFKWNQWERVGVLHVENNDYGEGYASAILSECAQEQLLCEAAGYEAGNNASLRMALDTLSALDLKVFFAVMFDDADFIRLIDVAGNYTQLTAWTFTDTVVSLGLWPGAGRIFANGAADPGFDRLQSAMRDRPAAWYNRKLQNGEPFAVLSDDVTLVHEVASYAYDAVAAIGLAACAVERNATLVDYYLVPSDVRGIGIDPAGVSLLHAIVNTSFDGASGPVQFDALGSRDSRTATYVVENALVGGATQISLVWDRTGNDGNGLWQEIKPFIFADQSTVAPEDSVQPSDCPAGSGWMGTRCGLCPAGTFREEGSLETTCTPCNEFEFQPEEGQLECISCGDNAHILGGAIGSTDRSLCVCDKGAYALDWPIEERGCRSCDDSGELVANCMGGLCAPTPKRGTWLSLKPMKKKRKTGLRSYRCRYSFLCLGGKRPVAAAGDSADFFGNTCVDYKGEVHSLENQSEDEWCQGGWASESPLCENARNKPDYDHDYFTVTTIAAKCPSHLDPMVFTILCWIALLALFFLINEAIRPSYRVLDVVLDVFQDLGLISSFRYAWPQTLEVGFIAFRISLFDVDIYEPTCVIPDWNFYHMFWLMISLPFVYSGLRLFFSVTRRRQRMQHTHRRQSKIRAVLLGTIDADLHHHHEQVPFLEAVGSCVAFVWHALPSLIVTSESVFMCRSFKGLGRRLAAEPSARCDVTHNRIAARVFAVFYIAVVAIGMPLATTIQLNRAWLKNQLCDKRMIAVFGFLYESFQSDALYWGLIRYLKQAALCTTSVILWRSPRAQAIVGTLVLLVVAAKHAQLQPCVGRVENNFELAGLMIALIMNVLGLMFTAGAASSESGGGAGLRGHFGDEFERRARNRIEFTIYVVAFIVLLVAYVAWAVYVTVQDRRALRARNEARLRLLLWQTLRDDSFKDKHISFRAVQHALQDAQVQISAYTAKVGRRASASKKRTSLSRSASSQSSGSSFSSVPSLQEDEKAPPQRRSTKRRNYDEMPSELMLTFKGPVFRNYMVSQSFCNNPDAEHHKLLELDRAIADFVADDSLTNNYSNTAEAVIYRNLDASFPALIDLFIDCSETQRTVLTNAVASIAKASYLYNAGGRIHKSSCIEPIDRSSILFFLMHCPSKHRHLFREFINKLVRSDPVLSVRVRQADAFKLALLLQRAFRQKQALRQMVPSIRTIKIDREEKKAEESLSVTRTDTLLFPRLADDDETAQPPNPALSLAVTAFTNFEGPTIREESPQASDKKFPRLSFRRRPIDNLAAIGLPAKRPSVIDPDSGFIPIAIPNSP